MQEMLDMDQLKENAKQRDNGALTERTNAKSGTAQLDATKDTERRTTTGPRNKGQSRGRFLAKLNKLINVNKTR